MVLYYKSESKLLLGSKFDEEKEEKKNEALARAIFDTVCFDNSENPT